MAGRQTAGCHVLCRGRPRIDGGRAADTGGVEQSHYLGTDPARTANLDPRRLAGLHCRRTTIQVAGQKAEAGPVGCSHLGLAGTISGVRRPLPVWWGVRPVCRMQVVVIDEHTSGSQDVQQAVGYCGVAGLVGGERPQHERVGTAVEAAQDGGIEGGQSAEHECSGGIEPDLDGRRVAPDSNQRRMDQWTHGQPHL